VRADGIREKIAKRKSELIDERELASALKEFDPIWDSLSLRERTRVIQLLIERVGFAGEKGELSITFRPTGIKALAHESQLSVQRDNN